MARTSLDDEEPDDLESRFLIAVWRELEPVDELAIAPRAIDNLPLIELHLAAALTLIRRWRSGERAF